MTPSLFAPVRGYGLPRPYAAVAFPVGTATLVAFIHGQKMGSAARQRLMAIASAFDLSGVPIGKSSHTATLLLSGDVLVTGGVAPDAQTLVIVAPSSAEVYDPHANRWSTIASMAAARDEYTATLLSSGRLLVVGGTGQSRAEVYDPARNVWSTASATMNRYLHRATRLPDARILVVGG
jgi:Kelch motif protein